ncbi:hypothetical protein GCM10010347_28530 [Streptomyces cirratus]|uniref:Secreted protein n=1 Tax=Streptomyces cirratus TaxID=68187 RepID=A0ABQ3ES57_9ACTN|nr:hypothetical protein [Streptomyces cirratus]GHB56712.1 hypothetical protein GCM10010347_28530 [Streptomyces cirratus]
MLKRYLLAVSVTVAALLVPAGAASADTGPDAPAATAEVHNPAPHPVIVRSTTNSGTERGKNPTDSSWGG